MLKSVVIMLQSINSDVNHMSILITAGDVTEVAAEDN